MPFNDKFRVLALTATPGSNMQAVRQVSVQSALTEPCQKVVAFFLLYNETNVLSIL